jgi:uncharacterized protein YbbC (DUF1343 family)
MTYGDLGWIWVSPSQHIPRWETCYYYAMTGVIGELGKLNVGVGTPLPFEQIGAPGVDGVKLALILNGLKLPGVLFRPVTFSPKYAIYTGKECQGVQIHVTDFKRVDPERISLELMAALPKVYADRSLFRDGAKVAPEASMFMKALGDRRLGAALAEGRDPAGHQSRLDEETREFLERRQKYLIYD